MTSPVTTQEEEKALQALAIALQHPAVAADQRNICTLLQVSKAWRAAVQESSTSLMKCSFQVPSSVDQLGRVLSFSGWLAKHAWLISMLVISETATYSSTASLLPAVKQLVEFALQVAASAAALGSGAPVCLHSYRSCVPPTAGLLAALPAATLTSLDMRSGDSNWFAPLSTLSNLQQLSLFLFQMQATTRNSCLREIGKLARLTQLKLEGLTNESTLQLLPTQLQHLQLKYQGWPDSASGSGAQVNLQNLHCLHHLKLVAPSLTAESKLPAKLQSLLLHARWPAGRWKGLTGLQHVTDMQLTNSSISRADLEALQHLPQLRRLGLSMENHEDILDVAAAWQSLPLCALDVHADIVGVTVLQQLMQHVAAATQLTKLEIHMGEVELGDPPDLLAICAHLQALKQLSNLTFNVGSAEDFVPHDAQHLSTLVNLTKLEIGCAAYGPLADDAILSLLAISLTGLKALAFNTLGDEFDRQIRVIAALPAIGRLTGLKKLRLHELPADEAQRGLQFLTGLSRLTMLHGFSAAGEAVNEFLAANRRQQ